ncbi:serine/threonine-protein kinase [Thermophilibacter sp.]
MDTDDELSRYLDALRRDDCYRVDAVYKQGRLERTERVFFVGSNGSELGPLVRKVIRADSGLGAAYELVLAAQRRGVRLAHLPRLVECHRRDEDLVVVMEHVPGETLDAVVGRAAGAGERLELTARVFPDLCDAVSELHERLGAPIVHRDLKPSNVMVSEGGVTLIDLGIARTWREGAEQDTTHFGTRSYAPPEQFGFGQTSVQSDVYALGMVLLFCLTGRGPSARDREGGFADAGLPEALRVVVVRATELDPAQRYATARELRDAFAAALGTDGEKEAGTEKAAAPAAPMPVPEPLAQAAPAPDPEPPTFEPEHPGLSALGARLSRVPGWAGALWNVVVLGVTAVLVVGCVMAVVEPTSANASWPAWYLVVTYVVLMVPLFLIAGYLLLDRRPLRREIPALARLTVGRETRAGLLAIGAILAVWALISLVAQPA